MPREKDSVCTSGMRYELPGSFLSTSIGWHQVDVSLATRTRIILPSECLVCRPSLPYRPLFEDPFSVVSGHHLSQKQTKTTTIEPLRVSRTRISIDIRYLCFKQNSQQDVKHLLRSHCLIDWLIVEQHYVPTVGNELCRSDRLFVQSQGLLPTWRCNR